MKYLWILTLLFGCSPIPQPEPEPLPVRWYCDFDRKKFVPIYLECPSGKKGCKVLHHVPFGLPNYKTRDGIEFHIRSFHIPFANIEDCREDCEVEPVNGTCIGKPMRPVTMPDMQPVLIRND